jgi:hypothetical protein
MAPDPIVPNEKSYLSCDCTVQHEGGDPNVNVGVRGVVDGTEPWVNVLKLFIAVI